MSTLAGSPVTAHDAGAELSLRHQLARLQGLLALSMLMTERGDEREIVHLATTAVPSLAACRIEGVYLLGTGWRATAGSCSRPEARADLLAQLTQLRSTGGSVTIRHEGWGWAFPLRSSEGHFGYLMIAADGPPPEPELFLLRVLAQQTGIALANARLLARQRAVAVELRRTNTALAETVDKLERKTAIHDRLTRVALGCDGQQGIARAVHELTGFPVTVEDRHGNRLAWAGPGPAPPHTKDSPGDRERVLERAVREGRPIRTDGRLLVVARPREDVLGVLSLIDPAGRAGEPENVALEHGATVLAVELARLQSLAETELRLGMDLVAELIAGARDGDAALAKARALGYDLERPHHVLVVEGRGPGDDQEGFAHAVRRAARTLVTGSLLLPRADAVLVLAPDPSEDGTRWERFRAGVLAEAGGGRCRVGVGGRCHRVADFPRSHREARLALRLQDATEGCGQAVVYDQLGVYQLLSEVEDRGGVERFVRRWLGDLLDYDARRRSELVLTLSRYLEHGGSYDATAAALAVGRSTLKYRLQRIRATSGHDLSNPDTRFNLQLATRAWCTLLAL